MIEILQQHWAEVFREKGSDQVMLGQWLRQIYPQESSPVQARKRNAEGLPNWRQGLPLQHSKRCEIRRCALVGAIQQSKNSAPGPDGIRTRSGANLETSGLTGYGPPCRSYMMARPIDI